MINIKSSWIRSRSWRSLERWVDVRSLWKQRKIFRRSLRTSGQSSLLRQEVKLCARLVVCGTLWEILLMRSVTAFRISLARCTKLTPQSVRRSRSCGNTKKTVSGMVCEGVCGSGQRRAKITEKDEVTKIEAKEIVAKEFVAKEIMAKEIVVKEIVAKEIVAKEIVAKEIVAKEIVAKEIVAKEIVAMWRRLRGKRTRKNATKGIGAKAAVGSGAEAGRENGAKAASAPSVIEGGAAVDRADVKDRI